MSLKFQFKLATIQPIHRTIVIIFYLYFGDLLFITDTYIYVRVYNTIKYKTLILYRSVHFITKNKVHYFC